MFLVGDQRPGNDAAVRYRRRYRYISGFDREWMVLPVLPPPAHQHLVGGVIPRADDDA
jgi:hypothetical protein